MYCVFHNLTYICPSTPCVTLVLKYPLFWNGWTRDLYFTYGSIAHLYTGCVSFFFPSSFLIFSLSFHQCWTLYWYFHRTVLCLQNLSWAVSSNLIPITVWVCRMRYRTERGFLGCWIILLALSDPEAASPFHKPIKLLLKSTWIFLPLCFLGKLFQAVSAPFLISRLNFPC